MDSGNGRTGNRSTNYVYIFIGGITLGLLGGVAGTPADSLVSTLFIAFIFATYIQISKRQKNLHTGLLSGGLIGLTFGIINWLLPGSIHNVASGLTFGVVRGGLIGAIAGAATRAPSDEDDSLPTKIFLFAGSMFLGVLLGGSVGLIAGLFLGLLRRGITAVMGGLLLGVVVGTYLGSYYKTMRWMRAGAFAGGALAAVSAIAGGSIANIIIGAFSGAIAPMLFVAAIAAVGGLTSRGVKAMVIEAVEAPTEMLDQGAASFLAPAIVTGLIVGAAAAGNAGLVALPATLAVVALTFSIMSEFDSSANTPEITPKMIVEMAMMGAENWPFGTLIERVIAKIKEETAWLTPTIYLTIGLIGTIFGLLIVFFLLRLL